MGLLPIEFSDCLLDSPYFRENLKSHEKQLDQTSLSIKSLISGVQEVLDSAKMLLKSKKNLADTLKDCQFDCLGSSFTDDEIRIASSLKQFAKFLSSMEDQLNCILENAEEKFITPLTNFRKDQIGSVKQTKKAFDKATAKLCAAQDRYIGMSGKKEESLAEAAESVRNELKNLNGSSLEYVYLMQVVEERKKFDFVSSILDFAQSWADYYKRGNDVASEQANYMVDLKSCVVRTQNNFSENIEKYDDLKKKMISSVQDPGLLNKMYTRQGYLFVQGKKSLGLGTGWTKSFCQYQAQTKTLTMIPYNQITGKITSAESLRVTSCICCDDHVDKFRFSLSGRDLTDGTAGQMVTHTIQALSEYERKNWVEALGGTWPAINTLQRIRADSVEGNLNSKAFSFLKDCLSELENRGLTDQGLYRVGGVVSKVKALLNQALDPLPSDPILDMSDPKLWESKTLASAVKQYFRELSKPLMTYHLYHKFVEAVKQDNECSRHNEIYLVLQKLPRPNKEILKVLIRHLNNVSLKQDKNLMTASNLGVVFGPTLLRPQEETVASIMEIKFCNEVIEIMIEHTERFFPSAESSPDFVNNRRPSVESQSTGVCSSTPDNSQADISTSPIIQPKNLPKRTKSFSSFSQLSTNSLPDIKEYSEGRKAVEMSGSSTVDRIVERPRSKSHQHNFPPISFVSDRTKEGSPVPRMLSKVGTHQDDLLASLEMMNSLAADLPAPGSPFKRSNTLIPIRMRRNETPREVTLKPPLPKLSSVPLSPVSSPISPGDHSLTRMSSSLRKKSLHGRPSRPTDLPNKLVSTNETAFQNSSTSGQRTPGEKDYLVINELNNGRGNDFHSLPLSPTTPKVFVSETVCQLSSMDSINSPRAQEYLVTKSRPDLDNVSLFSNNSSSPCRDLEDLTSSSDFLHSVTASSPLPITGLSQDQTNKSEESNDSLKSRKVVNISLDSGMISSPSPPADGALVSSYGDDNVLCSINHAKNTQSEDNRGNFEDTESVLSCSLSEDSDTSGSKYDNVGLSISESPVVNTCLGNDLKLDINEHSDLICDNDEEQRSKRAEMTGRLPGNVGRPESGQYENVDKTHFVSGDSSGCGGELLFNSGAGLHSLRRILTSGQTTNV